MKTTVILLLALVAQRAVSQCTATAALHGASFANTTGIGSFSWSNTSNAAASDNSYASANKFVALFSTVTTNYISAKDFGFSIPSNAVICGVEVGVERHVNGLIVGAAVTDNTVRLLKAGALTGSNQASAAAWPGAIDGTATYGGPAIQWGAAWTPADINDPNFGIALSADFSVLAAVTLTSFIDDITVTVYYDFLLDANAPRLSGQRTTAHRQRPTPWLATDPLTRQSTLHSPEPLQSLRLLDLNGRPLQTLPANEQRTTDNAQRLSLSTYPPGLYLLQIITRSHHLYTLRLLNP